MADIKTESSLLRAALEAPNLIPVVAGIIPADNAFEDEHLRALWSAIKEITFNGGGPEAVNPPAVIKTVKRQGNLGLWSEEWDVFNLYFEVQNTEPRLDQAQVMDVAQVLQSTHITRCVRGACMTTAAKANQPGADPTQLITGLQGELDMLLRGSSGTLKKGATLGEALMRRLDALDDLASGRKKQLGLNSGFRKLDRIIGGLQPDHLYIIGGGTKGGKSALALRMALEVALAQNIPVFYSSYELSPEMMAERFLCQWFDVNPDLLRWGEQKQVGWGDGRSKAWAETVRLLRDYSKIPQRHLNRIDNLYIHDSQGSTIQELDGAIRNWNYHLEKQGRPHCGLVFVDYIQLVNAGYAQGPENRQRDIDKITWGLVSLKKKLGIPVVALSQLNEAGDTRESRAPQFHCDGFWRIFREKGQDGKWTEFGKLELVLNRDAPCGVDIPLLWDDKKLMYKEGQDAYEQGRHGEPPAETGTMTFEDEEQPMPPSNGDFDPRDENGYHRI